MPSFLSKVFGGRKRDDKEPASPGTAPTANDPQSNNNSNNKRRSVTGSRTSLLDGKYEAVSPNVSPSATHFPGEFKDSKEKEKDTGFSLFRPKSRSVATSPPESPRSPTSAHTPLLTLNLPETGARDWQKDAALGVVFESDVDESVVLSDAVIAKRRLSPQETVALVDACSRAIVDRGGLEALGVMHPHWYSASPAIQRKLISLFILSLDAAAARNNNNNNASNISGQLAPTTLASSSPFNSELSYTRSPHDIAAVLRWALRHLKLEGSLFGSLPSAPSSHENEIWDWYKTFATQEHTSSYPPTSFTQHLTPHIPQQHHRLLTSTLDIISSLAAHAEENGSSGSKVSRMVGLWLVDPSRARAVKGNDNEEWKEFYSRWEWAAGVLEHVYLAYVRDETAHPKMPLRLLELVQHYPYRSPSSLPSSPDTTDLLVRPPFSTRKYDALYVRIETPFPDSKGKHDDGNGRLILTPVEVVKEALRAEVGRGSATATARSPDTKQDKDKEGGEKTESETTGTQETASTIFEQIRQVALTSLSTPSPATSVQTQLLSSVFDDESVRLLLLASGVGEKEKEGKKEKGQTPKITLNIPTEESRGRPTTSANGNGKATSNGNGKVASSPTTATTTTKTNSASATSPTTWSSFSTAGFGDTSLLGKDFLASTFLDSDVEKTSPPPPSSQPVSRRGSKRKATSPPPPGRGSVEARRSVSGDGNGVSGLSNSALAGSSLRKRKEVSSAGFDEKASGEVKKETEQEKTKSKVEEIRHVQLDEAFIDFWHDALLDPLVSPFVSAAEEGSSTTSTSYAITLTKEKETLPPFVLARLKESLVSSLSSSGAGGDATPTATTPTTPTQASTSRGNAPPRQITWLVLEHRFVSPPSSSPTTAAQPTTAPASSSTSNSTSASGTAEGAAKRSASPRPSIRSTLSSSKTKQRILGGFGGSLGAGKKRFSFFSASAGVGGKAATTSGKVSTDREHGGKRARVGELGEILSEEAEEGASQQAEGKKGETKEEDTAKPAELSPVPLVSATVEGANDTTPVATERINVSEGTEKPRPLSVTEGAPDETQPPATNAESEAEKEGEETLPPAPEPVVLTGSTPGPQVALSSSEPAAIASIASSEGKEVQETQEKPQPPTPETSSESGPPAIPEKEVDVPEVPQKDEVTPAPAAEVQVPQVLAAEPTEPAESTPAPAPTEPAAVVPEPSVEPAAVAEEATPAEPAEPVVEPTEHTPAEPIEPAVAEPTEPVSEHTPAEPQPTVPTPEEPAPTEPEPDVVEHTEPAPAEPQEPAPVELTEPVAEPTVPIAEPAEPAEPVPSEPTTTSVPEEPEAPASSEPEPALQVEEALVAEPVEVKAEPETAQAVPKAEEAKEDEDKAAEAVPEKEETQAAVPTSDSIADHVQVLAGTNVPPADDEPAPDAEPTAEATLPEPEHDKTEENVVEEPTPAESETAVPEPEPQTAVEPEPEVEPTSAPVPEAEHSEEKVTTEESSTAPAEPEPTPAEGAGQDVATEPETKDELAPGHAAHQNGSSNPEKPEKAAHDAKPEPVSEVTPEKDASEAEAENVKDNTPAATSEST
ncbi:hypothetical protein K474DRAFT_1674112 [Panus rudis PR-1116 ss-1]|nr:hypothetical protein K474DRAFT_1674112 [Panus rudis PR-1116 ss-1]